MREFSPGDNFQEKWVLQRVLGKGGFGVVWEGVDPHIGRRVAIKILKPDADDTYSDSMRQRFRAEAAAVARLSDAHTVTLLDYGESPEAGLYFVFEFVDGTTVKHLVADKGRLPVPVALSITQQLLQSLREAHAHGILHRDVKPENVMIYSYLGQDDRVKLADFGLAKNTLGAAESNITRDGAVIGTPRYMSPEALLGERLTPAADLFSVGLVLYEMLSGGPANDGANVTSIIARQIEETEFELPPLSDPRLRDILGKLLRKRPTERYQIADEVLVALRSLGDPPQGASAREGEDVVSTRLPSSARRVIEIDETLREGELELADVARTGPKRTVTLAPRTEPPPPPSRGGVPRSGVLLGVVLAAAAAAGMHFFDVGGPWRAVQLPWQDSEPVNPTDLSARVFDPDDPEVVYVWLDHLGGPQLAQKVTQIPASGRCAAIIDSMSDPAPAGVYFHAELLDVPREPFVAEPVAPEVLEIRASWCRNAGDLAAAIERTAEITVGEARLRRAQRSKAAEEKAAKRTGKRRSSIDSDKLESFLRTNNILK